MCNHQNEYLKDLGEDFGSTRYTIKSILEVKSTIEARYDTQLFVHLVYLTVCPF